jgi:alpha-galactosidase
VYADSPGGIQTLVIETADKLISLKIFLYYTVFPISNCIVRFAQIENAGKETVVLNNVQSLSVDLADAGWNMLTLTGAWAREFNKTVRPLVTGYQSTGSTRGVSSHQANPYIALLRKNTDEFYGEALSFSLMYSGNFVASAEVDQANTTRVRIGINDDTFSHPLLPGETFDTPEALISYSDAGLNKLSQNLHKLYRAHVSRGKWRDSDRPILLNNWEGTYFNFTEDKLVAMAKAAKDLGMELFVLDDGWFGHRDDDHTSLGDWFPHKTKLPNGIASLAEKITQLGINFGLWIEPEMISKDSELYKAHPDWAVGVPGRKQTEFRWQLVLDFTRSEIVDYIFNLISDILRSAPISYIKWDMNRYLTEPFSLALPPERQGEFFHRYCCGVYNLYDRLTKAHPEVLFESCSSGGGRLDAGILYYAPQGWLSDDTDAVQRLAMQAGASLAFPQNSWGSHVSAVPNHQTGRSTPLNFRAMAAFFGAFGYELDSEKLSKEEREQILKINIFYKKYRTIFQAGTFTRLLNMEETDRHYCAWMVSAPDGKTSLVGYFRVLNRPHDTPLRLKLSGLEQAAKYRVSLWEDGGFSKTDKLLNEGERSGEELVKVGLTLDCFQDWQQTPGDFFSEIFIVEKINYE